MPMKYLLDGELINIPDDVLVKIKKIINHDAMRLYKREATEEEFLECLPYTLKTFGLMIQLASEVAPRINLAKKYIEAQNSMSRSDYIQFEKDNPLPPGLSLTISAINSDETERENITKRQKSAASRPRPKKNIYGKTLNELIISYYKNNLDMTLAELWESFKPELERWSQAEVTHCSSEKPDNEKYLYLCGTTDDDIRKSIGHRRFREIIRKAKNGI